MVSNSDKGVPGKAWQAEEAGSSGEESSDSKLYGVVKRSEASPAAKDLPSEDQAHAEAEMARKSKKNTRSQPQKRESSEQEEIPERKDDNGKVEEEASPQHAAASGGSRVLNRDEDSANMMPDVAQEKEKEPVPAAPEENKDKKKKKKKKKEKTNGDAVAADEAQNQTLTPNPTKPANPMSDDQLGFETIGGPRVKK